MLYSRVSNVPSFKNFKAYSHGYHFSIEQIKPAISILKLKSSLCMLCTCWHRIFLLTYVSRIIVSYFTGGKFFHPNPQASLSLDRCQWHKTISEMSAVQTLTNKVRCDVGWTFSLAFRPPSDFHSSGGGTFTELSRVNSVKFWRRRTR